MKFEAVDYSISPYWCITIHLIFSYSLPTGGNTVRGRPMQTFFHKIGQVLENDRVKSTRNRLAFMRDMMKVEEVYSVCKEASGRK
jgi:hypothetical protein